jgi:hypothetical protein
MAPEILRSEDYSIKADVYSFGVLILFDKRLYYGKFVVDKLLIKI